MKKRNAAVRFDPAIPVSEHAAYVDRVISDAISKGTVAPTTPPVPMSEFGAPEFSIEPVKGARAFDVDKLGRLRGVSYDSVWTPGENEAACWKSEAGALTFGGISLNQFIPSAYFTGSGGYSAPQRWVVGASSSEASVKPPESHSLVGCKCGFYGYYDGSNDYHQSDRVSAVVEGYGEVVIGTRGFRATKARIVALTIPDTVAVPLAMRVRHNYREIPIFDSFEAMVTAVPTDIQRGPTPESDPTFWTRS